MADIVKDNKEGDEQEEKKSNPWPSRAGRVSQLEESLHNILDWGIIANLRGKFDYPAMILDKSKEEIVDENVMPESAIEEVWKIIREWDKDPESYVDPSGGGDGIYFKKAPIPVKPQREVFVEDKS